MSDLDDLASFFNSAPPEAPPVQAAAAPSADVTGSPSDTDLLSQFVSHENHETPGAMLRTGLESAARVGTLGLSDVAMNKLREGASAIGVNPDAIAPSQEERVANAQSNPGTSFVAGGLGAAPIVAFTGGLGAGLAGTALDAGMTGAIQSVGVGSQLGARALTGAAEGSLFGAGSAVSDAALGDPDVTASKVLSQISLGALLGTGVSLAGHGIESLIGKNGAVKGSIADAVLKEGDLANNYAKTASAMNALDTIQNGESNPEIAAIAQRQGLPLLEGQYSNNVRVKQAVDTLTSGSPTYTADRASSIYKNAYDQAISKMDEVLPNSETSGLTKATVGDYLQKSLISKIDSGDGIADDLYSALKEGQESVPLSDRSTNQISGNIQKIEGAQFPGTPQYELAQRYAKLVSENLDNVDDVKALRKTLNEESAGQPAIKRTAALISNKLKDLEESSISRHVDKQNEIYNNLEGPQKEAFQPYIDKVNALTEQKKSANEFYAPYIEKVKTLAEQLGKKKIYGPQDAIQFIKDLDPEEVTRKLFDKNDSKFLEFFKENFKEEMATMQQYQKQTLRDQSMTGQTFSPTKFFTKISRKNMEPEILKSIFQPDEVSKLKDMEKYFGSFPKNFNPSGTANQSNFRDYFSLKGISHNVRDFLTDQYIKRYAAIPDHLKPNPIEVGSELAGRYNQMNAISNIQKRTDDQIGNGLKGIFLGGATSMTDTPKLDNGGSYEDRKKRIEELAQNPDALQNHLTGQIDGITKHLPNVSQSITNNIATTVGFLNSKIPKPTNTFSLSHDWEPSDAQVEKFDDYYDSVNNPIGVLDKIKDGSLSNDHLESLATVHPALFKSMQDQVSNQLSRESAKSLPNYVKNSLSMFLGHPLEESQYQPVMQFNQQTLQQAEAQKPNMGMKSTATGLEKLKTSKRAATETQELEED